MYPQTFEANLYFKDDCQLGEGPFWFEDSLWWVDIEGGKLHTYNSSDEARRSHHFSGRIGVAVPASDKGLLVARDNELLHFNPVSGKLTRVALVHDAPVNNRFNDGKCDPIGRFLVGSLNEQDELGVSSLYSLSGNSLKRLFHPMDLSNGLAWSLNGEVLYHIDTLTFTISAFAYDVKTGRIGAKSTVVIIPEEDGYPDGMCIDCEGNLWVAHWDGGAVRCWSPETGSCLACIVVPCQRPTSCCFGGSDFDQLFITTARTGLSSTALRRQPLAGSIFVARPGVTGFPPTLWQPEEPRLIQAFRASSPQLSKT